MSDNDRTGSVELFKLMAVRPAQPAAGAVPKIVFGPPRPSSGAAPVLVDPMSGRPADLDAMLPDDNDPNHEMQLFTIPLASLDRRLTEVDDSLAPVEVAAIAESLTRHRLADIVETDGWQSAWSSVEAALVEAVFGDGDMGGSRWPIPTALLRVARLMGLLRVLADGTGPADAAGVQLFMRYSILQLPAERARPNPNVLARPPAIADLKKVRLGAPRYEPSSIAYIENVLASEKRERTHRLHQENEDTTTTLSERTEDTSRDLVATSNVAMQQEVSATISSTTDVEAGLKVSASYGPSVSVEANARLARHDSKEMANRSAADLSNSITQTAKSRIIERTSTTQTSRRLIETDETNVHSFDNTSGLRNIAGIYRHVDQVQDAWMENYGKRLMLEFVVPEPAATLEWAWRGAVTAFSEPEPSKPSDTDNPDITLDPTRIGVNNYLTLVGLYGAKGVRPPPPYSIALAVGFSPASADDDVDAFQDSKELKVPDGYKAVGWSAQCVLSRKDDSPVWLVGVGASATPIGGASTEIERLLTGNFTIDAGSVISVIMLCSGMHSFAASVTVTCVGTDGKKPAMCIMPLASICGSSVSCGSMTATPDRSILSLRCWAKISASRAAVLAWNSGEPRSRSTV